MKRLLITLLSVLLFTMHPAKADQPLYCIQKYVADLKTANSAAGFAPSDAELLVAKVARSISFQQNIKVVYCDTGIDKALAWPARHYTGIPDGDYIAVNPVWFREVIGDDQVQAVALFGHELGHFSGRHFESRSDIPQEQKEAEADHFAGCAVARTSGDWKSLENLLVRIRPDVAGMGYPSRAQSLKTAREGFDDCWSGRPPDSGNIRAALRVSAEPDTVGIKMNGYTPVNYKFEETKGVEVQIESEDTEWLFLNGELIKPIERFNRILGGSFPVPRNGSEIYYNNIYLPPLVANAVRSKGSDIVQLKHTFNCRDEDNHIFQVAAILKIYISYP